MAETRPDPKTVKVQVRIDTEVLHELDEYGLDYGGRSGVMRAAIDEFIAKRRRELELDDYLETAWAEHGGVDEEAVASAEKYFI